MTAREYLPETTANVRMAIITMMRIVGAWRTFACKANSRSYGSDEFLNRKFGGPASLLAHFSSLYNPSPDT
jgi:hypothetical protein